jgi:hypothetical protein
VLQVEAASGGKEGAKALREAEKHVKQLEASSQKLQQKVPCGVSWSLDLNAAF